MRNCRGFFAARRACRRAKPWSWHRPISPAPCRPPRFFLCRHGSMRTFFYATVGALAISIAIGWWGARLVMQRWEAQQRAILAQAAVQALLAASPAGDEGVAPTVYRDRIADAVLAYGVVADFPDARPATAGDEIQTEPAASGSRLFRLTLPLSAPIGTSLRLTRRASPWEDLLSWWLTWAWLNAIAGLTIALTAWRLRRRRWARAGALQQWVDQLNALSADAPPAGSTLPPEILFTTDPQLGELRDVLEHVSELLTRHLSALLLERSRSRLVLGNLHEGVLAIDGGENILLANESAARLLDQSVQQLESKPLVQAIRIPYLVSQIQQVLSDQQPIQAEFQHGTPSRKLQVSIHPLPLSGDRPGALVSMRDVSRIRHLEHVRRDFIANASHELKTPIAAIRAYAETLHMGAVEDKEATEQFLAHIIGQADRLNALVQGMLQLARAESGRSMSFQSIDVSKTLAACATAARALCESKGVAWQDNLAELQIQCVSAPEALQTIVNNLLSNAVRYTSAGGCVRLQVGTENGELHIVVADTGQGIPAEEIDRIFERFYRAARDRAENPSGTGLGLAIVKHLTQELGGRILATSRVGHGSSFTVVLPLAPVPSTELA
ncbi:MAG: PAS domain-containing protein [Planctomycetota bacterium]|nr:MAG: PAS domain-containing protein [Planctomycetota bacterium]